MDMVISALQRFLRDEDGQDNIEYGLLAALIAIAVLAILLEFANPLQTLYDLVLSTVESAAAKVPGS
jgi:Flp pilus assembly pilin Flp